MDGADSVRLILGNELHSFYLRVAEAAGLPLEQVLYDALFLVAGELSLRMEGKKYL